MQVAPRRWRCSAVAETGYVTDGSRLFRVVAPVRPGLGIDDAVLEDCRTLAWRRYFANELWALRLRRVRAAGR